MVPPFCLAIKPLGGAVRWFGHLTTDLSVIYGLGAQSRGAGHGIVPLSGRVPLCHERELQSIRHPDGVVIRPQHYADCSGRMTDMHQPDGQFHGRTGIAQVAPHKPRSTQLEPKTTVPLTSVNTNRQGFAQCEACSPDIGEHVPRPSEPETRGSALCLVCPIPRVYHFWTVHEALLMAWMPPPDGIAMCQCDVC